MEPIIQTQIMTVDVETTIHQDHPTNPNKQTMQSLATDTSSTEVDCVCKKSIMHILARIKGIIR